jgi:2-polyprenyl-3-methyl-5-hydroxy-6-metoxy-1,4-benzoquinol methylase
MTNAVPQSKQREWFDQWSRFQDQEQFLFEDWISPFKLEDFRGLTVLEAGCGGGQHTAFMAPYAKSIVAVDLNTVAIARERTKAYDNVVFEEADIATMDLKYQFDVVLSVGVVHHTDDPDRSVTNLIRHL